MSAEPGRPLGSTYRLQLNGTGFVGARRLVAYLSDLGVETLYVSPVLAAAPGSAHGYDVVDPTWLDPALGTPEEFGALLGELGAHRMRLLLDIVPNHMATAPENRWWWDLLGKGEGSPSASWFDVDWERGLGKVVLAVLEAPLGELLASGSVRIDEEAGVVSVGGSDYPLDQASPRAGDPAAVLERQHYRLAYWRVGPREVNYRRFFDIDQLVGVRVEDPDVYRATHALVLELASDERVAGLRIDHIDGLADPAAYLERLRADLAASRSTPARIVVEKILGHDETLPGEWPVDGTTGYEFAALATRLFVDADGAAAIAEAGARLTGERRPFEEIAKQARAEVLLSLFPGPADRLATLAHAALWRRQPGCDLTFNAVRRAIGALVANLDVYRTYLDGTTAPADRSRLEDEAPEARADLDAEGARAFDSLSALLLDDRSEPVAIRLQQLSGAVAAKGVEDTACYRFPGLLAGAEVGASPDQPSIDVETFHAALGARAVRSPGALNALSTHDTKRSADVRARLAALSEVAGEWVRLVGRWHRRSADRISAAGGPDPFDELFFYQSLVGIWPLEGGPPDDELRERLQTTTRKAAREAKRHTSWRDPSARYEAALARLVDEVLDDEAIIGELDRLTARIGPAAATYSLGMTVLAATAPGVPDVYQGSERWQLALMDPDNRRAVDHKAAAAALAELASPSARELLLGWRDGRIKLQVTAVLLRLRRRIPAPFATGDYVALETAGRHRDRVVAFARHDGAEWVVSVVPRGIVAVVGPRRFAVGRDAWADTRVRIPDGAPRTFVDPLTGTRATARAGWLSVGGVLGMLPVAVLASPEAAEGLS